MKFACILAISLFSFVLGYPQIQKGAVVIYGGGSFSSTKSSDEFYLSSPSTGKYTSNMLNLQPSFGKFVNESWLMGVGINFQNQVSRTPVFNPITGEVDQAKATRRVFSLNLFARKYFKLNDKFYASGSISLSGGLGNQEYNSPGTKSKSDILTYGANISPALTYFLSGKWSITAGFGQLYYQHITESSNDISTKGLKNRDDYWGLNFQLNAFSVGIQYFLRNSNP